MTLAAHLEEQLEKQKDENTARLQKIGEDQGTLRVLNFSGGGFDSVMQLGVTHALLVNQGRSPDIVVGVSAGAIHAAALAETLRAGVLPDGDVSADEYADVLGKRVAKFRKFADACYNAPEMIVDTVVPDAYQIDSFEPLAALRLPRLSSEERDERDRWVARKTGLVRLYNDFLSIDLPFGALTRLVRRGLGVAAANAITSRAKRGIVKFVEFMRLWLVAGSELRRLAPVIPIIVRPLVGGSEKIRHSTAGSIIFKFRPIENLWKFIGWLWSFVLVLNLWVIGSWLVVASPFLIVLLADWLIPGDGEKPGYLYVFYFLYLLPIVLPLTPITLAYDRTRFKTATRDLSKGMFAFFYYLVKWTVVLGLLMLATVFAIQFALLLVSLTNLPIIGNGPLARTNYAVFIYILVTITVFLVVVRPAVWMIAGMVSYKRSRKNEKISAGKWYMRRFLDSYRIGSSLADNYNLKRLLVEHFDPGYYGGAPIESVLEDSLKDAESSGYKQPVAPTQRRMGNYLKARSKWEHPIIVAVTAADVGTGRMIVLPQKNSIVDNLLAATAVTPIFPAVKLNDKVLIDAVDVGNNPTKALVELFQHYGLADVNDIHIYPIEPLPVSSKTLNPNADREPILNLIDIVGRALQLQRFRDATVDRLLTQVLSDTLPAGMGTVTVPHNGSERTFFRARFAPVELEHAPGANRKVLFGDKSKRRETIGTTIASGCRAALEVMHREVIRDLAHKNSKKKRPEFLKCQDVIDEVFSRRKTGFSDLQLPGARKSAPGLVEVCKYCEVCDHTGKRVHKSATKCLSVKRALKTGKASTDTNSTPNEPIPDWPHELEEVRTARKKVSKKASTAVSVAADDDIKNPDADYPVVAGLFSGGVFRGVFQLGVLNALSMLDMRPRIVAGASVGSITAAMVASALSKPNVKERKLLVAKLAATYVGIDRIILTDRFADFIRNWTIRASEAKFSVRQMDKVFRKYDQDRAKTFQRDVRQVLAGLERLFYLSPYQVNSIVRAIRNRSGMSTAEQLKDCVRLWLDRMEVGEEVLGAEPIQMLIEEFVIPQDFERNPAAAPFDSIDRDLLLLATTTNLTRGRLEILPLEHGDTTLMEGLLASSAFPGVFRPRRSWDLNPGTHKIDQFIDGGVMDNLPLEPVLTEMRNMADSGTIPLRSKHGPNLMFAASLEVDSRGIDDAHLDGMASYWPELRSRAEELKYNTKLDNFERVTASIQSIHRDAEVLRTPMRVKVLAIKPRWLPSTFAFHPMLGFRRKTQIRSIAHGCAATLLAFGGEKENIAAWKMNMAAVPPASSFKAALKRLDKDTDSEIESGNCWLLNNVKCPFSEPELDKFKNSQISESTKIWLNKIHESCWNRKTHSRQ